MKFRSISLVSLILGVSCHVGGAYQCDTATGTSPIVGPRSLMEDIIVPEGGICTIVGEVNVMGSIYVGDEAILEVGSVGGISSGGGTLCPSVVGSIKCMECDSVEIAGAMGTCHTNVMGSIDIMKANTFVSIRQVQVGNGIRISESDLPIELTVEDNIIMNNKGVTIEKCTSDSVKVRGNMGADEIVLTENEFGGEPEFDGML